MSVEKILARQDRGIETTAEMQDAVEQYIDSHCEPHVGVNSAVDAIAEVCRKKAEHLRTNWQDETSAKMWEELATLLDPIQEQI